jgi:hypothetical protein
MTAAQVTTPAQPVSWLDGIGEFFGLGNSAEEQAEKQRGLQRWEEVKRRISANPNANPLEVLQGIDRIGDSQVDRDLRVSRGRADIGYDSLLRAAPIKMGIEDNTSQNKINEGEALAKGDVARLTGLASSQMPVLGKVADLERYVVDQQQGTVRDIFNKQYELNREAMDFNREQLARRGQFSIKDGIGLALAAASLFA